MPHRDTDASINQSAASLEIALGILVCSPPLSGLQACKSDNNNPTQDTPCNMTSVKTTSDKRVTPCQHFQAPGPPRNRNLSFGMEQYLNATPQDSGPTYDLVRADLESRLNTIASTLLELESKFKEREA